MPECKDCEYSIKMQCFIGTLKMKNGKTVNCKDKEYWKPQAALEQNIRCPQCKRLLRFFTDGTACADCKGDKKHIKDLQAKLDNQIGTNKIIHLELDRLSVPIGDLYQTIEELTAQRTGCNHSNKLKAGRIKDLEVQLKEARQTIIESDKATNHFNNLNLEKNEQLAAKDAEFNTERELLTNTLLSYKKDIEAKEKELNLSVQEAYKHKVEKNEIEFLLKRLKKDIEAKEQENEMLIDWNARFIKELNELNAGFLECYEENKQQKKEIASLQRELKGKIIFDGGEFYDWMERINILLDPTKGVFKLYNPAYSQKKMMAFIWENKELYIKMELKSDV